MSTRAIVTSQPDIACYVCERRLLRGEQHEVFLADGQPRTVCELCAPRAAYQGWPREHEDHSLGQPPLRSRRGRGLFGRLRQTAARGDAATSPPEHDAGEEQQPRPYEELAGPQASAQMAPGADQAGTQPGPAGAHSQELGPGGLGRAVSCEGPLERALEAFNGGESPRRVASLARSLGAPEVSVHLDEDLGVVTIVVAWELCWYRHRVDIDEPAPEVRMIAQGNELEELAREDRLGNALADELGALSLIPAQV